MLDHPKIVAVAAEKVDGLPREFGRKFQMAKLLVGGAVPHRRARPRDDQQIVDAQIFDGPGRAAESARSGNGDPHPFFAGQANTRSSVRGQFVPVVVKRAVDVEHQHFVHRQNLVLLQMIDLCC